MSIAIIRLLYGEVLKNVHISFS